MSAMKTNAATAPLGPAPSTLPDDGFDAAVWKATIEADLELRRKHTTMSATLHAQYVGDTYREGYGRKSWDNFGFEWCCIMVPQMVMTNPTVRITEGGVQNAASAEWTAALQGLIPQIELEEELRLTAYDTQFDWPVLMTMLEPTPGLKQPGQLVPMRPTVKRLSPRQYFTDHMAGFTKRPRHDGHLWVADIRELKAAQDSQGFAKYDTRQLTAPSKEAARKLWVDMLQDGVDVKRDGDKLVVCATVYVAAADELWTLAYSGNAMVRIRRVKARTGGQSPYTMGTLYPAADQVYPLPPIAPAQGLADVVNAQLERIVRAADKAKEIGLVDGKNEGIIAVASEAPDGSLISAPGITGEIKKMKFDGAPAEAFEFVEYMRAKLDRKIGMTDQLRGVTTGKGTAYENSLAGQANDIRVKYAQMMFRNCVRRALLKLVAMMDLCDDVLFPFVGEDPMTGQPTKAIFTGGRDPMIEDPTWPFEENRLVEIEPYSMEYTNAGLEREQVMALQAHVIEIATAAMTIPGLDAEAMIEDAMKTMNVPKGSKKYFDAKTAAMVQLATLQAGAEQEARGAGMGGVTQNGNPRGGTAAGRAARSAPPRPQRTGR